MYVQMELLARDKYETFLREAEAHRTRRLAASAVDTAHATRRLPLPRVVRK